MKVFGNFRLQGLKQWRLFASTTVIGGLLALGLSSCGGPVQSNESSDLLASKGNVYDRLHSLANRGYHSVSSNQSWEALRSVHESPEDSNKLTMFYTRQANLKKWRVGSGGSHDEQWNREHVWPKSKGADKKDLHNLMPTFAHLNSRRGNKDFDVGGSPVSDFPNQLADSDSFEPLDEVKGDVARILFYNYVKKSNLHFAKNVVTSSGQTVGNLCEMVRWHYLDPVSDEEKNRNDGIEDWQGNRNPFIDEPTYVDALFGHEC